MNTSLPSLPHPLENSAPTPADITGLVLAGGLGRRMGGVDKGLQLLDGQPLARRALERLRPQVGAVLLNANRHLEVYQSWGVPVWPDADGSFAGPLAGLLAGLEQAATPWVACVPCDSPHFPLDLVQRLAAHAADADVVMPLTTEPSTGRSQPQPVFSLVRCSLVDDLARFLAEGGRRFEQWAERSRCRRLVFADAHAFANANTSEELARLATAAPASPAPVVLLQPADAPAYKRLRDLMLAAYPSAFSSDADAEQGRTAASYEARLTNGPHGFSLGVHHGGELAGAITCETTGGPKTRHTGRLVGMMVRPGMQGRGIGRRLLAAAVAQARRERGLVQLVLTVSVGNEAACRLYERAGFRPYGLLPRALKLPDGRYLDKQMFLLPLDAA